MMMMMMGDIDVRQVCKICYGSSSHKPNPTLTPESKAVYNGSTRKCSVCRQGWASIRVARDTGLGCARWVRLRQRPKISTNTEFQMCKNMQGGRGDCPRGLDCSYAHYRVELDVWNAERKLEPRPAPPITGPYLYQLCKHVQTAGKCPYGQRCTFAHSEEEFHEWMRSTSAQPPFNMAAVPPQGMAAVPPQGMPLPVAQGMPPQGLPQGLPPALPQGIPPPAPPGVGGFRCDICCLTCTSKRQLEDHLSGGKHRERLLQLQGTQSPGTHDLLHGHQPLAGNNPLIRKRPLLSFQIMGFKMCMHVQANRRCVYGDFCTFAHSNEELQAWNRQLATPTMPPQHTMPPNSVHYQPPCTPHQVKGHNVPSPLDQQRPNIFAASSGLDEIDETLEQLRSEGQVGPRDFADDIRRRIVEEFTAKQEIGGFEKFRGGVCLEEVSGQELCLTWTQPDSLHWTFEVSSTEPRVLSSVVLLDTLATDFTILGAWSVQYGGAILPIPGTAALQGAGLLLRHRITERVHVKISLKPRSGVLGQLVIFDFGTFYLSRALSIHMLSEAERKLMVNVGAAQRSRPAKRDLYWEQHYTTIAMPGHEQDEVFDAGLSEYPLPEQIEKLIEAGKYNNVENRVTKENYKRRLHNLLYLEEYQQRQDMSRYDLYDIEISVETTLQMPQGTVYAMEGFYYVTVSVEEVLFEGGRSIRPKDSCLLLPMNQQVIHQCWVEAVGRDRVTLKVTDKAKQASASSRNRCSLRFVLSRTHMREMHYAVDQMDMAAVFPEARVSGVDDPPIPPDISKCLQQLKSSKLNQSQQAAIYSMLDPACQQIPSLVLGPFGCGKTRTLRECIMLLSLLQDTTILICTHSNSAANIYVQELHREYSKRVSETLSMLRIYYTGRRLDTIPPQVRPYCKIDGGQLALPTFSELKQYRIVVVTLSTSRALSLMGLSRGHFSHIFIDEAAQALEAETLIPLVLAGSRTKVVLAGDHMQMDPPCYSAIARKYGLHVSLLERLFDHNAYDSGVGQLCKTLLTENHRSHPHIMEIPSKLFYKNKLTCRAEFPSSGPQNIPPLKFIGVDGQEEQDEDSPSYYNNHEALKITEQVKLLVSGGLQPSEVCVLSYYQKQVSRIRQLLRNERLGQVSVFRVDDVQGKEFRALLLSTVRTCYARDDDNLEEDAGFLTNPKLFNTAVTRAKEWLVVCGEPVTLCTVGSNRLCWIELIKKCLHQLNSFEYPNAAQFEVLLQTKLFTRKILERRNQGFILKVKKMQTQPLPPTPATISGPPARETPSPQQTFAQAPTHVRQQMVEAKVSELAHGDDRGTVKKITEELMKLSVQEQSSLLARPEVLQQRVQEIEGVLRRPGPTAALLNSNTVPNLILGQGPPLTPIPYQMGVMGSHKYAPDLPPFLTSIIDGLTNYMKWCDMHLQNPQNHHPGVTENLSRQRANLGKQSELVNEQITTYRELLKIVRSTTGVSNMDTPANRGPHMPPPVHPHHQAPGANSAQLVPSPSVHHHQIMHNHHPHHHHPHHNMVTMGHGLPATISTGVTTGVPPHQGPTFQTASSGMQVKNHTPNTQGASSSATNSAFTYGMASYFPNADPAEPIPQLSVQTNLTPSKAKGLSPLEAAINDVSSRSSPQPLPPDTSDVYLSDDEFNS